jgi:hypothetical protein
MTSAALIRAAAVCPGLSRISRGGGGGDDRRNLLFTNRNLYFRHQTADAHAIEPKIDLDTGLRLSLEYFSRAISEQNLKIA